MPSEEEAREFLKQFTAQQETDTDPTQVMSWQERAAARKEDRIRTRQEAAEKAKATLEGRGTGTPARKKDGKANPEYMVDYRQKQKDEGLMGKTDPNSVWANLGRGVRIRPEQMGQGHQNVGDFVGDAENVAKFITKMRADLNLENPQSEQLRGDNYQGHDHPDLPPGEYDRKRYAP